MTFLLLTSKNLYHSAMLENSDFHSKNTQRKIKEPHPTKFNIIILILAWYKGHLPCSRTPRTVTVASRSIWSLMLPTVEQTQADVLDTALPTLSPTTTQPTSTEHRCFLHHTLTHINSPHTTWFSKGATHQKMSIPASCWTMEQGRILHEQDVKFF